LLQDDLGGAGDRGARTCSARSPRFYSRKLPPDSRCSIVACIWYHGDDFDPDLPAVPPRSGGSGRSVSPIRSPPGCPDRLRLPIMVARQRAQELRTHRGAQRAIDIDVHRGEVLCLVGASGSGKIDVSCAASNHLETIDRGRSSWLDGQTRRPGTVVNGRVHEAATRRQSAARRSRIGMGVPAVQPCSAT